MTRSTRFLKTMFLQTMYFLSGIVLLLNTIDAKAQDVDTYSTPGNPNLLTVKVLSTSNACWWYPHTYLYYQIQGIDPGYIGISDNVGAGSTFTDIDVTRAIPGFFYLINFQLRNLGGSCDYSHYVTKAFVRPSIGPYFTSPAFSAQWNQNRGSVSIDADFYKYRQPHAFYEDLWVNDMIVEYSADGSPYAELCHIKSSKQTSNRGQQYRNYTFEPKNGNQFEIRNRTNSTDSWVKITGISPVTVNEYSNNENFTARFHWQIPSSLTGKTITLRYRNTADVGYDLNSTNSGYSESRKINAGVISQVNSVVATLPVISTSYTWQNDGSLKYTLQNPNGIPAGTTYFIFMNGGVKENYFPNMDNIFNYSYTDIAVAKGYITKATYSPNPEFPGTPVYTIISAGSTVKAFILPEELNVTSDGCTHKNTVQFSVGTFPDASYYEIGNFELIRSEDSTFQNGVKNLGQIPFIAGQANYTYTDPEDFGINSKATYFYKLRRTPLISAWGWSVHTRKGGVNYNSTHEKIKTISTTIIPGTIPTIKVTWDYLNTGVWCDGTSKLILYRDGGSSGTTKLTEITQKTTQEFIDNSTFATCTPYSYRIEIGSALHGTSIFASNSITLPLDASKTPELSYFKSSKGFYNDRVELEWTLAKGTLSRFLVKRKLYEEPGDKFATIADISTSSSKLYKYIDNQAVPSIYYSYLIVAVSECNGTPSEKELLSDVGFRIPTGSVSGRVVYTGDVPVEGCNIIIQGADQMKNRAVALGNGTLQIPHKINILNPSGFSIQAWIKLNTANNGTIFDKDNQFQLLQDGTTLVLKVGADSKNISFQIPDNKYFHLSIVKRSETSYEVFINSNTIETISGYPNPAQDTNALKIGAGITGYIDELRIWNKPLTSYDIASNFDRYISGKEQGLLAYYRLDEGVNEYIFDMSLTGSNFNENHGIIKGSCPRTDVEIPTSEQVSLKGKTDANGNYLVAGIPYYADGTSYIFTPQLGTHDFNPKQKPLFLSDRSAVQNNVDFTDISSFKYNGVVTYEGGNYPVEGVSFFIDGRQAIDGRNNSPIVSNAEGMYSLQVPIGQHTIEARKYGHEFVRDTSMNFQADQQSGCNFQDKTRIKLIGRIVGGNVESKKSLLVGESVNNLGKATIVLTPAKSQYSMRTSQNINETVEHDGGKLTKPTTASNDYTVEAKKITIHTSPATGEFVAYVYPEDYSLKIDTKNVDIMNGMSGGLYLKNSIHKLYEVRSWTDSVTIPATGTQLAYKKAVTHVDSVLYNAKLIKTHIVDPEFSLSEMAAINDSVYRLKNYHGDSLFVYSPPAGGIKDTIQLVTSANGIPDYTFGRAVYTQGTHYFYAIEAYEKYINADNNNEYKVPVSNCKLIIDNTLKVGSYNTPEPVEIGPGGKATYSFTAGIPDLTTGLKKFDAVLERDGRTFIWTKGYVPFLLGSESTGANFTTSGPSSITAVLRDPPGSNSYEYLEKGSTFSYSGGGFLKLFTDATIKATIEAKPKVVVWAGFGAGTIVETEAGANIMIGAHVTSNTEMSTDFIKTITCSERYETSSDPLWVGADADLFIGNSTNILYGATNSITIGKGANFTPLEPGPNSYAVGKGKGFGMGQTFGTEFAYTQRDLEKIFMPAWEQLRNSQLLPVGTVVDSTVITKPVFISLIDTRDTIKYGSNNSDIAVWGNLNSNIIGKGPSYRIVFPFNYKNTNWQDSVMWCNNQIKYWKAVLAENEKQKLEATLIGNKSFTSGSKVEYSKASSSTISTSMKTEFSVSLLLGADVGFDVAGVGVSLDVQSEIGIGGGISAGLSSENTRNLGFVLQESSEFDALTVDYKNTKDGSISFNTRAGQTSCPYEGATITKYYKPGAILSEATMKMEVPKLSIVNSVANQVPANRPAVFTIQMKNESEVDADTWFLLMLDGYTNPNGAIIAIDGQQINESGRTYLVRAGQTLTKTLTLTKGPSAMDYKDIRLILASTCQFDKTSFTEVLSDEVYLSASFIPNCSDVNLALPSNNWVMNTTSGDSLLVKINGYDVNFANFGYIMLQSKTASSSGWKEEMKFFAKKAAYDKADGAKILLDPVKDKDIRYWMKIVTSDNLYDIRAVAYCVDPTSGIVLAETPTVIARGVKDMVQPVLFGSTQPADGVLNSGDEIQIQFNEDISEGLITKNNISVTGIKNGINTIHTAAVHFDGLANSMVTEQQMNLADKSFTFEAWVMRSQLGKGVIISHGETNGLELGFTTNNKLYVKSGTTIIESQKTYNETNIWNHYALVFDNEYKKVSVYVNGDFSISDALLGAYNETGILRVASNAEKTNFLSGDVHELRAWNVAITRADIAAFKSYTYQGSEKGIIGYWPMNEGKGLIAQDHSRGRNGILSASWALNPSGKSVSFTGIASSVKLATEKLPVKASSDYSIELWFKGGAQTNACLFSAGRGDGEEWGASRNNAALWFDEMGLLNFASNGNRRTLSSINYLNNQWHHVAICVNRLASANFYVDGSLVADMDARQLTTITAASMYLGERTYMDKNAFNTFITDMPFKGQIDEFRIWNLNITEKLVNSNNNIRLQGDETGLAAYYPFDAYAGPILTFNARNQVTGSTESAVLTNSASSDDYAPVKIGNIPEKLGFEFVTNKDKINIKLTENKSTIERTLVTIAVSDIQDLNENVLASPVKWSAYIDQSQLRWVDDQINITKAINKEFTFKASISNTGGTTQEFTLTNLPAWLSVDVQSGSIKAGVTQEFTFTVDKGLNVGSYDEVIYLKSEYNQPLGITLSVMGELPDWTVDPTKFSASMNIIANLKINDILSTDKNDKVAVFVEGVCAGVAQPVYYTEYDKYFTFIKVYGNTSSQNKKLTFRIFDASTGKIFSAKPSTDILYVDDKICGTLPAPVTLIAKDEVCQSIALNNGWSWISFNVTSSDLSKVQTAFTGMKASAGDIVKDNNLGLFDAYSNTSKLWSGTLTTGGGFKNTAMYLIRTNAQTLSVAGTVVDPGKVKLAVNGGKWNYLSYLPTVNLTLQVALAGYSATDNDVIKSQNAFAIYDPLLGWLGDLKYLEPNKGYMLYRTGTGNTEFTYPNITNQKKSLFANSFVTNRLSNGKYPETMGIIAKVKSDVGFNNSDWILGYNGDELVSATQLGDVAYMGTELLFANIDVNGDGIIRFVLEQNGIEISQARETFPIAANHVLGTLDKPQILTFKETSNTQMITAYPNPVKDELHVRINNTKGQKVTVYITDMAGKSIMEDMPKVTAGNYLELNLNTSNLKPGMFMLKVTVDNQMHFLKLIKN